MAELKLGTIKTFATLSGYIYLHLPTHVCKNLGIGAKAPFKMTWCDGVLIITQEVPCKAGT
jgi:hypothetical protein